MLILICGGHRASVCSYARNYMVLHLLLLFFFFLPINIHCFADAFKKHPLRPIPSGATSGLDFKELQFIGVVKEICTGTLIAPDIVLTSAHCLPKNGVDITHFKESAHFEQGKNLPKSKGIKRKIVSHIRHEKFMVDGKINDAYDYGILFLQTKKNKRGEFYGFAKLYPSTWYDNFSIFINAYPEVGPEVASGNLKISGRLMRSTCTTFSPFYYTHKVFYYRCSTKSGMSGAALFSLINGEYYIVGVHSAINILGKINISNEGVRITHEVIGTIEAWIKNGPP